MEVIVVDSAIEISKQVANFLAGTKVLYEAREYSYLIDSVKAIEWIQRNSV